MGKNELPHADRLIKKRNGLRYCECGYNAVVCKVYRWNKKTGLDESKYKVTCTGDCDYTGEYDTREAAIAAWNRRLDKA
jgi:hypothetical protein